MSTEDHHEELVSVPNMNSKEQSGETIPNCPKLDGAYFQATVNFRILDDSGDMRVAHVVQ